MILGWKLMGSSLRLLELVSRATRFDGSVWLGVISGNSGDLKKRLRRRRCGFSFRLAWEASRSRPVMGLLTLWRSRLQLVTFLIEPFSTLFSSSLSCCPSSSFSLLSLRSKVSTTAPPSVLSMNLLLFQFWNLSFWVMYMHEWCLFRLIVMDPICFLVMQLWKFHVMMLSFQSALQNLIEFFVLFYHETTVDDKSNFQWSFSVIQMTFKIWWLAIIIRKLGLFC